VATKTFTEQANTALTSGSTAWDADGEGLHSELFFDAVRGLNNMAVKSGNYAVYAQGIASGKIQRGYTGAAREVFMAQVPVIVPPWRYRLLWTAGVTAVSGSITSVTTYISPVLYNGPASTFDATNIRRSSSEVISMGGITSGYALADASLSGIAPVPSSIVVSGDSQTIAYVIITITGGTTSTFTLRDYACWFSEQ